MSAGEDRLAERYRVNVEETTRYTAVLTLGEIVEASGWRLDESDIVALSPGDILTMAEDAMATSTEFAERIERHGDVEGTSMTVREAYEGVR